MQCSGPRDSFSFRKDPPDLRMVCCVFLDATSSSHPLFFPPHHLFPTSNTRRGGATFTTTFLKSQKLGKFRKASKVCDMSWSAALARILLSTSSWRFIATLSIFVSHTPPISSLLRSAINSASSRQEAKTLARAMCTVLLGQQQTRRLARSVRTCELARILAHLSLSLRIHRAREMRHVCQAPPAVLLLLPP